MAESVILSIREFAMHRFQPDHSFRCWPDPGVPAFRPRVSGLSATRLDTSPQAIPNAPGANAERVHGYAQPPREAAATIDPGTALVGVILDYELALRLHQRVQASIQALQPLLAKCPVFA